MSSGKGSKKPVIAVGDLVVVTNPEFVVRVGYPMSYKDAFDFVVEHHFEEVEELLRRTVFRPAGAPLTDRSPFAASLSLEFDKKKKLSKELRQIFDGLARLHLQKHSYGGPERTIHTTLDEAKRSLVYEVVDKKVCKTGTYDPPYSYQDYEGEWDCYSGGLTDCKTHVLLELDCFRNEITAHNYPGTWVESCNVRKYDGPPPFETRGAYAKRVQGIVR